MFRLWGLVLWFLSALTSAQELRLGFGSDKPPYVFEGEAKGLEFDIVVASAQRAGFTVRVRYAPMERLQLMLRQQRLDCIATTNESSGEGAFFSDVYIRYQNVAVALADRRLDIERISDLSRFSVSTFQRARLLLGSEFQQMAEHNPGYREEAFQIARNRLLYIGRVDVVVGDLRILRYFNHEVAGQVDVSQPLTIYPLFPPTAYRLGCSRAADCQRFNLGLAAIRKSGEYAAIEQRYAEY